MYYSLIHKINLSNPTLLASKATDPAEPTREYHLENDIQAFTPPRLSSCGLPARGVLIDLYSNSP